MNAVISPECIAALDPAAGRMEDHWLPTSDAGKNLLYGRHLAIGAIDVCIRIKYYRNISSKPQTIVYFKMF